MSDKNTGGPAFPVSHGPDYPNEIVGGITTRDYFAAMALQGICASGPSSEWTDQRIAASAFNLADAMLAERAK